MWHYTLLYIRIVDNIQKLKKSSSQRFTPFIRRLSVILQNVPRTPRPFSGRFISQLPKFSYEKLGIGEFPQDIMLSCHNEFLGKLYFSLKINTMYMRYFYVYAIRNISHCSWINYNFHPGDSTCHSWPKRTLINCLLFFCEIQKFIFVSQYPVNIKNIF